MTLLDETKRILKNKTKCKNENQAYGFFHATLLLGR